MVALKDVTNIGDEIEGHIKNEEMKIESECFSLGYGSPAPECLVLSYLATTLYLNKYYEVGKKAIKYKSVMCTGYIIKMGLTAFIGTYFIMLTFAELYLGQNSYDQVIMGYLLGAYFGFLFHNKFKLKIIQFP